MVARNKRLFAHNDERLVADLEFLVELELGAQGIGRLALRAVRELNS